MMSIAAYLLAFWCALLLLESLISAGRALRVWRKKRAFRRLSEQLRRCAELHPIPNARSGQATGE